MYSNYVLGTATTTQVPPDEYDPTVCGKYCIHRYIEVNIGKYVIGAKFSLQALQARQ